MKDNEASEARVLRLRLTYLGAAIGGLIAFIASDLLGELLKVALGLGIGWIVGLIAWMQVMRSRKERAITGLDGRSKTDLMNEARRLEIEGRGAMTKDELAEAIADHLESAGDGAADAMRDAVDDVRDQMGKIVGRSKRRYRTG